MTTLAERLRTCRENAGMTQAGLGEVLEVTPTAISHWEVGRHEPRPSDLPVIARALGLPSAALLIEDADDLVQYVIEYLRSMQQGVASPQVLRNRGFKNVA